MKKATKNVMENIISSILLEFSQKLQKIISLFRKSAKKQEFYLNSYRILKNFIFFYFFRNTIEHFIKPYDIKFYLQNLKINLVICTAQIICQD